MMALIEPGARSSLSRSQLSDLSVVHPRSGRRCRSLCVSKKKINFSPTSRKSPRKSRRVPASLIFNSPNNPTGTVFSRETLEQIADLAVKHDLWVIADEIYARIVFNGEFISIRSLPGMAERTIIIDGFSKSFAMTGWRLGYAVAPKQIVDAMDLLVLNTFTCVAEFTQVAAIEALRDSTRAVDAMVAEYRKRRDLFVARLNRIPGFRCQVPDGSFYAWVNMEDTGLPAKKLPAYCSKKSVSPASPAPRSAPQGKNYLRFSLVSARHLLEDALDRIERLSVRWRAAVAR